MADQTLICSGCSLRYKAPRYNPAKTYQCPQCRHTLRLESRVTSVAADGALDSRGQPDHETSGDPLVGRVYEQ